MDRRSNITKINSNKSIAVIYFAGLVIILSIWFFKRTFELSAFHMIKYTMLIVLSYIVMVFDIHTKRIPNKLVLTMMTGWFVLIFPMLFFDTSNGVRLLVDSICGLLIGGGLFILVYLLTKKGLGGGDVKFISAAGLYLGFTGTIHTILYGTILASITGVTLILLKKIEKKDPFPLAPFLFIGIMITVGIGG
jgi:leader peptidase (prepilin peptidase)/N-methyltransferase